MQHVRQVLARLVDAGLALNRDKSTFGVTEVDFLGHHVSAGGIFPRPSKVSAIRDISLPRSKVDLQRFLGCINYYHCFVPGLAGILAPFHTLLSSVDSQSALLLSSVDSQCALLPWTDAQRRAFTVAKDSLANAVLLVHPDPDLPLSLTTPVPCLPRGLRTTPGLWLSSHRSSCLRRPSTLHSTASCWLFSRPSGTSCRAAASWCEQNTSHCATP